jgi:hypothetical protein
VLADPARWSDWWPGLVRADPTVRRALAPGALWNLEGTESPSLRHRPQLGGTLLFIDVVPLQRVVFQMTGERAEVELELERVEEDDQTAARLAVDVPRFGGLGRTFPSRALAKLAALVRPADT